MKKHILYIILLALLTVGCSGRSGNDAVADFTDTVYAPRYAKGYTMMRRPGHESILISVRNAWQGCDTVASQVLMLRGGEQAPAGFSGTVIDGDAKRIVTMSSTNIAMLDAVGEVDRVVGVSGLQYITNPKITACRPADVGYAESIDYERILSLKPDLVMIYGVDGESAMVGKLRELGVPYIYIGEYMEQSPLGKAEWVVPVAAIAGKYQKGVEFFTPIARNYEALKAEVKQMAGTRPKVIVNAPYSGSWFMPTPDSYSGQLVTDAGGQLLYDPKYSGVAVPVEMEAAWRMASQADVWINPGQASSLDEVRAIAPKYTGVDVLTQGRVWNNNRIFTPAGGNDYFESGVIHPDRVLRDLISIFHPGFTPDTTFYYYKKLQ